MRTMLLMVLALWAPALQAGESLLAQANTPRTGAPDRGDPDDDDFEPVPLIPKTPVAPVTPPATAQAAPPVQGLAACALGPDRAMVEGPVVAGFFAADVATGRRVCPRTEVGLVLGGDAEIDIPQFRALIGGGATVFGSFAINERLEVFGTLEAFRVNYSQNASLSVTVPGVGQLTGGATYALWSSDTSVLGVTGRLMLPTSSTVVNVRTTALEAGALFSHRIGGAIELHGLLGSDLTFGLSSATAQPRLGFLVGVGGQWAPLSWFAVALDLQTHFGDRGAFDYLAPALGFRFQVHKQVGLELALATHVAGDRALSLDPGLTTESLVALRGAYRF